MRESALFRKLRLLPKFSSYCNRSLDGRPRVIVFQGEIFELEVEQVLDIRIQLHRRQRSRCAGKLLLRLVKVIAVQVLDIGVFDRLRQGVWWRAPLVASVCSATLDTAIFWSVSFAGQPLPWVSWALGDLAVKLAIAVCLLVPFRIALFKLAPAQPR